MFKNHCLLHLDESGDGFLFFTGECIENKIDIIEKQQKS